MRVTSIITGLLLLAPTATTASADPVVSLEPVNWLSVGFGSPHKGDEIRVYTQCQAWDGGGCLSGGATTLDEMIPFSSSISASAGPLTLQADLRSSTSANVWTMGYENITTNFSTLMPSVGEILSPGDPQYITLHVNVAISGTFDVPLGGASATTAINVSYANIDDWNFEGRVSSLMFGAIPEAEGFPPGPTKVYVTSDQITYSEERMHVTLSYRLQVDFNTGEVLEIKYPISDGICGDFDPSVPSDCLGTITLTTPKYIPEPSSSLLQGSGIDGLALMSKLSKRAAAR